MITSRGPGDGEARTDVGLSVAGPIPESRTEAIEVSGADDKVATCGLSSPFGPLGNAPSAGRTTVSAICVST